MSASGFLGPCAERGLYHDGGAVEFSHDYTIPNWLIIGDPVDVESYTASALMRGRWQVFLEVISPTTGTTTDGVPPPPTNNNPRPGVQSPMGGGPPGGGFWGFIWPNLGYNPVGDAVDNGDGTLTQNWEAYKERQSVCIFNVTANNPCCTYPDCTFPQSDWDTRGQNDTTPRELPLDIQNDGFFGSPGLASSSDYTAKGIPQFTTIRFSGYLGDSPP